jgi:DNA polymerase delta subunit 1
MARLQVLGVPPGADSTAVQRAYKKRLSEAKGNDAELQRIEAAHSSLMMSALTSRMQGKGAVDKDVLYADRARYFPWRPRFFLAERQVVLYAGIAQALLLAWALLSPLTAGTQPVIWCKWPPRRCPAALECGTPPPLCASANAACFLTLSPPRCAASIVGAVGNVYKQNRINPPPARGLELSDAEKKQGGKNILRGCFLAVLGTFAGCLLFYTAPDAVAAQLNRVMPFWFYEGQSMLLAIGSCLCNLAFTALFR